VFSGGSLTGATPSFTPDLVGTYTLLLAASDSDLTSATASVTVTAISQNEKPIAVGDNVTLLAGANISPPWNLIDRPGALADDFDANGFTHIYQASPLFADLRVSAPVATCPVVNPNPLCATVGGVAPANTYVTARGAWVTNNLDGTVTYRRRPGFRGSDSFNYRIFDRGGLGSNLAQVRVNAK
jgi:hypothetical protein